MLQLRGLCSPLTRLALHNVVPARLSNAHVWYISRLYASAAKDTASDQHQDLITKIRAYQKEDVTIPWYALAAQYRLSYDSMEQILAQDDARIREQKELSVRITQRADQLYDEDRGCCDWDTVANEFDKSLTECLGLYDTSLSTTVRQSRPSITDWPVETIEMLKTFIKKHADLIGGDNLRLFGIYINVRDEDCIPLYSMLSHLKMTPELYELIKKCREDGMEWKDIYIKYPFGDSVNSEAKRQYEQQSNIDWAQISQSVGLSELRCLEICQYDEGKARWAYDPDTFSWDTANKMIAFIKANYPPPAPVNYRAVSNYMWVDANDCARMAMMLRGDMKWTDEIKEKIVKLRKQRMEYENIARQISPII
ncbi:hypothetical protein H4R24_002408 [Coemansia sp. RSA 988]|nr:hypothetical protein H4R24_002408 [Coemansia sp. RSA 988]